MPLLRWIAQNTNLSRSCLFSLYDKGEPDGSRPPEKAWLQAFCAGTSLSCQPLTPEGNLCFACNNEELQDDFKQVFSLADLADYCFAVLHTADFNTDDGKLLKAGFAAVPHPRTAAKFWQLTKLGRALRRAYLQEDMPPTTLCFPEAGSNRIEKIGVDRQLYSATKAEGRVWINDRQYFSCFPRTAWSFKYAGRRPAQDWLQHRHAQILQAEDILIYQKIIVSLEQIYLLAAEADRLCGTLFF